MPEDVQKSGFFDYIAQNEGLRLKPYKDIKGFGTIGYGHLIKKGEQFTAITKKKAKELFDQDLKHAISVVKNDIGEMHWGILPDRAQIALADMAFRTDWQKSPTAKGHFKNEDYFAFAKEYLDKVFHPSDTSSEAMIESLDSWSNQFKFTQEGLHKKISSRLDLL